jgi:PKD repeat protein
MKSKLKLLLAFACLLYVKTSLAQSQVSGVVRGLRPNDSAIVRIQKSSQFFYFQKVYSNSSGSDAPFQFNNLPNGRWSLSMDARGYNFPSSRILNIQNSNIPNNIFQVTQAADTNFVYQWQDDSSYVGHAQQAYINEPVTINVLGIAEPVPSDFNSINILNEYGYLLSNDSSTWTNEDTYRLYLMFKKLNFQKFGERDTVRVRGKIFMSLRAIDRDIDFYTQSGIDFITISRAAFTYATPQVVTLDGIKGKFFSKRLYNSVVYYYTNRGTNSSRIDEIASTRYGLQFLSPSPFLQQLMNETSTNFQQFTSDEKLVILSMFEEFPDAMQRQDQLKYLVRRINGQPHPVYNLAPAIAWVTMQTIEWMESAFSSQAIDYMQRLVLHEKAHFLWEHTFSQSIKDEWATIGGWYLDPTVSSGWSTTNTTQFVSAYAHAINPNEDMAESIAFYITNPDALRSRSQSKFDFIRDRIMKGSVYIAIINPALTFTVYNLFPDYNYPGKIKRTKVEVVGGANQDKTIKLEIELTTLDNAFDGASWASCRFTSSIGTFFDMGLFPTDSTGKILRGERTISKFAKSGYWTVGQIRVADQVGNQRLENNNTYGLKCYVNNPMEDVIPPLYIQNTLVTDSVNERFTDFGGAICQSCPQTMPTMPAMKIRLNMVEANTINPNGRVMARVFLPTFDTISPYNIQPYSFDVQASGDKILNDFPDSMKTAQVYFPIPYYYPRGYYSISYFDMQDIAFNVRTVHLDLDTGNTYMFMPPPSINQRAIRDSMYFHTPYPDLMPPKIDLNDIEVRATPTNPTSPNGETLFEMWLWIKDTSNYPNFASGFNHLSIVLRDPQGLETHIPFQPTTFYDITPDSSSITWRRYRFSHLLPAGSPPGIWGVSSMVLQDKARNKKYYSFVEFVRFDVEGSSILQRDPYLSLVGGALNASNSPTASFNIGCDSCAGQYYRLKVYSSMGGAVLIFTGQLSADTILLSNLNLTGVNDGNLHATLFILDSTQALIGLKRATYIKDTEKPIATITRSQANGISNIYNITTNENVTNPTIAFTDVVIQNGILLNVERITQRNFRLEIERNCKDSLLVSLRQNALSDLSGNTNDSSSNLIVDPIGVRSSFTIVSSSQCLTNNIFHFSNLSTTSVGSMSYQWNFGTITNSSAVNPTFSFPSAGSFNIKLIVSNSIGCSDSTTQQVVVHPMPVSGYTFNSNAQCLTGNSFEFTNTSSITSGSLTQHAWSFGDGGTATTLNATRSYTVPGSYSVKLVSTSNEGCKDSTMQQVVVNPMPAAGYTINSSAQCLTDNSFGFTNTSSITTGSLAQYSWDFGDGGTATTLNATRSYAAPGTYTVKLVSTSNNGCKDSTTQQAVVHPMPSTSFAINNIGQCLTGNSFTFTNNSVITTGSLTQHAWNFADGGTATTLNATRSYTAPGTYAVKLVSTSNNGCKDSTTRSVTVHPMPLSIFSANTAIQCLTGNTFQFSNNSMISSGTLSSNWSFGNGATSTFQSPMHSYAAVGSYTVKLVSTSNNGCKDSTTRDMRVDPSPTANLTIAPYRSIHPGLLTTISANVTPSGNYQYTWYRNSIVIPNKTTTVVDSIGYRLWSGAYKMAVANPTPLLPCTYTTPEVVIGDSVSAKLFIYPSPNTGQFKVTYYSPANTRYQIVITDTKGAVLYRRQHEVTNRYQLIDINLTGASRGLYLLQVQDPSGKPLTSGKFVIH